MKFDGDTFQFTDRGKFGNYALMAGIFGLILCGLGWFVDAKQFFHSYLTALVYWTTIALGGLFFVMLHYLVNAKWSVVIRRFGEGLMMSIPLLLLFFIPVLIGLKELYHWADPEIVASDHLLQGKTGFLNVPFFIIRLVGYFVIWTVLAYLLNRLSLKQDKAPHPDQIRKLRIISAPGMVIFAVTITFASFDWLMSLDAHWYSTIFGVYIFSGSFLSMLALITFIIIRLHGNNILTQHITKEHYHDLGKLIFAFTIFWGYMAFSQYFLIWYANIPEETVWFLHRWDSSWKIISLILVFGHFGVPFFVLFPQEVKRNKIVLIIMTIWILVMHWVDMYWLVMPTLHHHGVHFSWIDPAAFVGIGGIFLYFYWRRLTSNPLIPVGDPNLKASINIRS